MAHFAGGNFPATFGPQTVLSATATNPAATATSSTEGTDKLTYIVPQSGWYRVSAVLNTVTTSGGSTHTIAPQIAYNNGSAISAATIGYSGVTPGTLNAKTAIGTSYATSGVYYMVAATTTTITLAHTVGDTNGSGTTRVLFVIEGIA